MDLALLGKEGGRQPRCSNGTQPAEPAPTWLDDIAAVQGVLPHEEHAVEHGVVLGVERREGREAARGCGVGRRRRRIGMSALPLSATATPEARVAGEHTVIPGSRLMASEMGCEPASFRNSVSRPSCSSSSADSLSSQNMRLPASAVPFGGSAGQAG